MSVINQLIRGMVARTEPCWWFCSAPLTGLESVLAPVCGPWGRICCFSLELFLFCCLQDPAGAVAFLGTVCLKQCIIPQASRKSSFLSPGKQTCISSKIQTRTEQYFSTRKIFLSCQCIFFSGVNKCIFNNPTSVI